MRVRWLRRAAGFLQTRLSELKFGMLADVRARRGRRWQLAQVLRLTLVGLMSGARSLADVEALSSDVTGAAQRLIGIGRRLADTSMRDVLVRLDPMALRPVLHRLVAAAHARRALRAVELPFGVVAMDGKATAIADGHSPYAQRHIGDDGVPYWLVRTITSALVSAAGRPCVDVMPIPSSTNERGVFAKAFGELVRSSGHLFQLMTYDAGATCAGNAATVVSAGKDYMFAVKADMGRMYALIRDVLDTKDAVAEDVTAVTKTRDIVRRLRLMRVYDHGHYRHNCLWPSTQTILRIDSYERTSDGERHLETRLFASSLVPEALGHTQWLAVVRGHWGVECVHQTLDTALAEDDKPFMPGSANGTLAVLVLRRIAYTALALFRAATRSEVYAEETWRRLLQRIRDALIAMTDTALDGLRPRTATRVCG